MLKYQTTMNTEFKFSNEFKINKKMVFPLGVIPGAIQKSLNNCQIFGKTFFHQNTYHNLNLT